MTGLLLPWLRLPWPMAWAELHGREAPLALEVGIGKGDFLGELARRWPGWNLAGIEVSRHFAELAAERLERSGLTNVRVLWAEGAFALRRLFPPASLAAVYINHPDPWPKARHAKRRLIQPAFLELLAARLVPGGTLELATDHRGYAEWIVDCYRAVPYFESLHDSIWVPEIEGRTRTRYEEKARARGEPVYYFQWRLARPAAIPAPYSPPPEEAPLPHVILAGEVPPSRIGQVFQPWERREGETFFRVRDAYVQRQGREVLLEAILNEEGLERQLFLVVRPSRGRVTVKAVRGGWLRPTPGLRAVIRSVAGWLEERFPELEIQKVNA